MLHDLHVYFSLGGFTFLARHGHPEAKECQRADMPSVRPLSYVSWFINPKHPIITTAGWWYTYPSEKYEFVSWDQYFQYMESHNPAMFQTTNQKYFVYVCPSDSGPTKVPSSR